MKALKLILVSLLLPVYSFAQFTVNAGRDTSLCTPYNIVRLGGNPSASGGEEPYIYKWECKFIKDGFPYNAGFFLDNPNSPNPRLKELMVEVNGPIKFILKVTDNSLNIRKDSVIITISSISWMHTADPGSIINLGDSVKLEIINVDGGIPPFTYLWTPNTWISDPGLKNPYVKPLVSTQYFVRVTDSLGCVNNDYYYVTVLTTGIEDMNNLKRSHIFPNPIDENSTISLFEPYYGQLTIKVIDSGGRIILNESFSRDYLIGLKIRERGIYIYHILSKGNIVSYGKFLKTR